MSFSKIATKDIYPLFFFVAREMPNVECQKRKLGFLRHSALYEDAFPSLVRNSLNFFQ